MKLAQERAAVAVAARRLAAARLVLGTAGNVSMRRDDLVAISPTGAQLAELRAEQVAVVDLEGEHVAGELQASSELDLHLGVYERYGAGAVVHTHAPVATALACVLVDELPVVHYALLGLGGAVRVAPYRTFGTRELAEATLEALEGRTAALMANHGTITYAADADAAVESTLLLEWACEVYWRAIQIGTPRSLDAEQCEAVVQAVVSRSYGALQQAGAAPTGEHRP